MIVWCDFIKQSHFVEILNHINNENSPDYVFKFFFNEI